MLIDFTVRNYRSIKNEVSLNMESNNKNIHLSTHVIPIENGRRHLYPFSVIYGANASGKSNVVKALEDFVNYIQTSNKLNVNEPIPCYKPFRLDTQSRKEPTMFQIEVVAEKITYLYTVEFTEKSILKEELYFYPNYRKTLLFNREGLYIQYGKQFKGEKKAVEFNLLENRLLLTLFGNSKNEMLKPLYNYFDKSIKITDIHKNNLSKQDDTSWLMNLSNHYDLNKLVKDGVIKNKDEMQKISTLFIVHIYLFMKSLDFNVDGIKADENENFLGDYEDDEGNEFFDDRQYIPEIGHRVFEGTTKSDAFEYFNLENEESTGTKKIYILAGSIIETLFWGGTIVIDEFNSSLHPFICESIISLFTNERINTNHAQLIVATHDLHILDPCNLKREQVWFTEKDKYGISDLFSMDEFEENNVIRDNKPFSKYYITGRFGALPRINTNELEGLFNLD